MISLLRHRLFFKRETDRGAVAVEFALIFPIFLFMILFMLDAGRYLMVQMAMNNAAEVGARSISYSADTTTTSTLVSSTVTDAVVRLSTLDATSSHLGVVAGGYICPLNSESYYATNPVTQVYGPSPDGNCTDLSNQGNSGVNCSTVPANYRAMARASVTFKWITPLGLIIDLADPNLVGPNGSIYFNRNATDTTTIEGKAKLLCQN
jgi:Flp pilus assembly protein TadG